MKSIINTPFVLLFAFVVEGKAQQSIYHGDWIEGLVSTLSMNQLTDTIAKTKTKYKKFGIRGWRNTCRRISR